MPWSKILLTILVLSATADKQTSSERLQDPTDIQTECVDCAFTTKQEPFLPKINRLKRDADTDSSQDENPRRKRDFIQWYGGPSSYQQPSFLHAYQFQSPYPYFVPVWGNPRRIPVFFPARPILFNPGYPARNPPGFKPTTTEAPVTDDGTKVSIGNRINVNEEGEPIWGIIEPETSSGGGNSLPGSSGASRPDTPGTSGPSRPPSNRPIRPKTPPLLHRPSLNDGTQTPRPGLGDRDNRFPQGNQFAPSNVEQRPPIQFRPMTTARPFVSPTRPPQVAPPQGREEPNRCVWAIISCCNPANNQISYNCFERLGCPGAFWDSSPCSKDTVAAALNTAAKFYEQT